MDELEEFLRAFAMDARMPPNARAQATRLYNCVAAGILPSLARVQRLKKYLKGIPACGHLREDGSCAWLRRNARSMGLRNLKPGEAAYCKRQATGEAGKLFIECPGYTKIPDEE